METTDTGLALIFLCLYTEASFSRQLVIVTLLCEVLICALVISEQCTHRETHTHTQKHSVQEADTERHTNTQKHSVQEADTLIP